MIEVVGLTEEGLRFAHDMSLRCRYLTVLLARMAEYRSDIHEDDVVTWVEGFSDPDTPNFTLYISRLGDDLKIIHPSYHTIYLSKEWVIDQIDRILQKEQNNDLD